jgi:hypothetical protein
MGSDAAAPGPTLGADLGAAGGAAPAPMLMGEAGGAADVQGPAPDPMVASMGSGQVAARAEGVPSPRDDMGWPGGIAGAAQAGGTQAPEPMPMDRLNALEAGR